MTEHFRSRRYLLDPGSDATVVGRLAATLGWPLLGELVANPGALESYEVMWGKSRDLTLHYQEELFTLSPCAFITGENEARVRAAARVAEQQLKPATPEELLEAADAVRNSPADYMLAIQRLGLGAPVDYDERFFVRIQAAFEDEVDGVRKAAVWATSSAEWPQFEPLLAHAAVNDPAEDVRADAELLLDAYRAARQEWGEQQ
ncbi:hypothetical protein ACWDZ8_27285 [Streptomyces sp. NPDC003233]